MSYGGLFVYIITGYPAAFLLLRLTRKNCRDKITGQPEYAGTATGRPGRIIEYAGMVELVDSVDLGSIA